MVSAAAVGSSSRVLLVDDHELIRQGLRRAFERDPGFHIVAEAASVAEGLAAEDASRPDVAIVDVGLPDGSGIDLAYELRQRRPDLGIVVLTMYDDDKYLFAAVSSKASAFVLKSASSDELLAAARHAAALPHSFTTTDLAGALMRRSLQTAAKVRLTPRESELLDLLKDGLPVSSIAARLYISQSTAKTHMSKLYEKLGARNRTQAIMSALRLGLIADLDAVAAG